MATKNKFDNENWILNLRFYSISLSNGKNVLMWTYKEILEIENEIKEKDVLIVESGRFDRYRIVRIQTSQIVSIEDRTYSEKQVYEERNNYKKKKLEIVNEIRRRKPSFLAKRRIKRIENDFNERKHIAIDYDEGEHLDPLMGEGLEHLKEILNKCR